MSIIKVCGMRDTANILQVDQLNIQWMGFIFYPFSPRFVGWDFKKPEEMVTPAIGVFVNESNETIEKTIRNAGLDGIQLHGEETAAQCFKLKKDGRVVIKAFGISQDFDLNQLNAYELSVDYFLFDTATPIKGGSGKQFDHQLLDQYQGSIPFILSGGLGSEDVQKLRSIKHPLFAGIDLNSKFEIKAGIKNTEQLNTFINDYRNIQ